MDYWIEYIDGNGISRKRGFRDLNELNSFASKPPRGVQQFVTASHDIWSLAPTELVPAHRLDATFPSHKANEEETRSSPHEVNENPLKPVQAEHQQELPENIDISAIERIWNDPKCKLPLRFTRPKDAAIELIERYLKGWALSTLERELMVSRRTIKKLFADNGIKLRLRRYRNLQDARPGWEDVFAEPTPAALYWAGFLMADGSIVIDKRTQKPTINCRIMLSDIAHIRALRDFVGRGKIYTTPNYGSPLAAWSVHSDKMAYDLAKFGIVPGKGKLDDAAPKSEARMSVDFWRGMIDGDGSIGMTVHSPKVQLTGRMGISKAFIEFVEAKIDLTLVRQYDRQTGQYEKRIRIHKYPEGGGTKVILNGPNAWKLCKLLYENVPEGLYLLRKRKAALELIEKFRDRYELEEDAASITKPSTGPAAAV